MQPCFHWLRRWCPKNTVPSVSEPLLQLVNAEFWFLCNVIVQSLSPAINKLRRLPVTSDNVINSPWSFAEVFCTCRWNGLQHAMVQNRDFCLPHLHSTPPLRAFLSEYCHDVWCRKTRMAWLLNGEKNLTVWLQYWNVTDGRTDRQTDGQTDLLYKCRASVCWRATKRYK